MALESGELASTVAAAHLKTISSAIELGRDYSRQYKVKFGSRLTVSGLLRRTAFNPHLAEMTIIVCSLNGWARSQLARATRSRVESGQSTVSTSWFSEG